MSILLDFGQLLGQRLPHRLGRGRLGHTGLVCRVGDILQTICLTRSRAKETGHACRPPPSVPDPYNRPGVPGNSCKRKTPCEEQFPGVPACSHPFVYNTAGAACAGCNEEGYRPGGRPKPMDSSYGVVLPTHHSCIKNRRPGNSIVCGTCCVNSLNGKAYTTNRCKCAPQRDPDDDDDDDDDYLYD